MFGFFRRQPSAYAVAIRDSMIREPEKWKLRKGPVFDTMSHGELTVWCENGSVYHPTLRINYGDPQDCLDRRCIREGIEAWIVWSLSNKRTV